MDGLTTKELIILIIILAIIFSLLGYFFQSAIRVIIAAALIVIIGSIGFLWLPQKIDEITSGKTTVDEVVNDVKNTGGGIPESIGQGTQYVKDNYQSWGEAAKDLAGKIFHTSEKDNTNAERPSASANSNN